MFTEVCKDEITRHLRFAIKHFTQGKMFKMLDKANIAKYYIVLGI